MQVTPGMQLAPQGSHLVLVRAQDHRVIRESPSPREALEVAGGRGRLAASSPPCLLGMLLWGL